MKHLLTLLLLAGSSGLPVTKPEAVPVHHKLQVTVTGFDGVTGDLRIALFNTTGTWLETPEYAHVIQVTGDTCRWTLADIPAGEYGIAAFHDVNGNGEHDTNLFGVPKEPYGFSNDARGRLGPPAWSHARFQVPVDDDHILIHLQ